MKKILKIEIFLILIAVSCNTLISLPDAKKPDVSTDSQNESKIKNDVLKPSQLAANYAILIDIASGEVLFDKNADSKCYPASTTKILTALLVLENISLDEEIIIGDEANLINPDSSKAGIRYGEKLSIRQLLHGLLIGKIENGNLDERIDIRSDDELGDLAGALNRMTEKLKKTLEDQQRAEDMKKEIISSVSHDLRTPLTSFIGFLGLLTNRKAHSDEDLEKYAGIAHKKALRLQELTDELFEFTRLNYNEVKMKVSAINLSELLEQLVEEFYPVFEQHQMVCRLSLGDEKICIQGGGDLLARVFDNLFNNAIRYGNDGKAVDVRLEREEGRALIHVTNYGECIPAEHLPYIFDKFYRAETSRSGETGGTGLGLAIVKTIVEMHRGTISVESQNHQTSFHISLPAEPSLLQAAM